MNNLTKSLAQSLRNLLVGLEEALYMYGEEGLYKEDIDKAKATLDVYDAARLAEVGEQPPDEDQLNLPLIQN